MPALDQTLTDGGAAPATYFVIDDPIVIKCGPNRRTGFAKVTQLAVFSPSHTAVNADIMLEEGDL